MDHDQSEIRRRAYALWERGGRPNDQDLSYWLEAERQIKEARQAEDPAAENPAAENLDEGLEETFPASDTPASLRRTNRRMS